MSFKAAFLCSVSIHLGLLAFQPPAGLAPSKASLLSLEVTFLPVKVSTAAPSVRFSTPEVREPARNFEPKRPASEPERPVPAARREEPREKPVPRSRPPEPPSEQPPAAPSDRHPQLSSERPEAGPLPPTAARAGAGRGDLGALPASVLAEIAHKEQVMEHLKRHLRYPALRIQGMVRLVLEVAPNGRLLAAEVTESSHPRLKEAALTGLREAAPYPAFSEPMEGERARYEFLVRYQLQ